MRTRLWIPVAVLLFFTFIRAQDGELEYGLMTGLNLGQFSQKLPETTSKNRLKAAMLFGAFSEVQLHPQLWMRGEFLYTQKGNRVESKLSNSTIYSDYILHYLSLNVTGQYIPVKRLVIYFGPQVSYLLSAKWKSEGTTLDATDDFKPIEVSVLGGVSYQFLSNFEIQFRYEFGLSNLFPEQEASYTLQNRVMSLILAYRFGN